MAEDLLTSLPEELSLEPTLTDEPLKPLEPVELEPEISLESLPAPPTPTPSPMDSIKLNMMLQEQRKRTPQEQGEIQRYSAGTGLPTGVTESLSPETRKRGLEVLRIAKETVGAPYLQELMAKDPEALSLLLQHTEKVARGEKDLDEVGLPKYRSFWSDGLVNSIEAMGGRVANAIKQMGYERDKEFAAQQADGVIDFGLISSKTKARIDALPETFKEVIEDQLATESIPLSTEATRFAQLTEQTRKGADGYFEELAAVLATPPEDMTGFSAWAIEQGIRSGASPLAGVGVGLLTRSPLAGSGATAAVAGLSERFNVPMEYIKKRFGYDLKTQEGRDDFLADPEATEELERFGRARGSIVAAGAFVSAYAAGLRPFKTAIGNVGFAMGAGGVTDLVSETAAQYASTGEISGAEAALELLGGLATAPLDIVIGISDDLRLARETAQAEAFKEAIDSVVENLQDVPEETVPSAAQVMADKLKDDGVKTVYIKAEELQKFDQDGTIAESLGLDQDDLALAAGDGHDIAVDIKPYIEHVLGVEGFQALVAHTRADMSGLTPAEAKAAEEAGGVEQVVAEMEERAIAQMNDLGVTEERMKALVSEAEQINADVAAQLTATGRYSGARLGLMAQLIAQRYTTRALRASQASGTEVSALDLYRQDKLMITGQEAAPVTPTTQVDPLLQDDAWKQQQVTVRNEDGTEVQVNAGEQMAAIQEERSMAEQLMRCIGA